ncbi:fibronectin type III domain-containing protein [Olleya sp. Bg11-27]|uniref:fibronectin type III domain-containing protein n=1 Tax=Olleya sp. Bg11-27 TaxID=2058135 RepID=UPI000C31A590|nr:fibronectin type III domain-containing protein [Olleya sp. Bg11-27]AUC76143.1 hypothetical protein CW732_10895 [Olleya sp. Bg11-27]
MKRIVLILTFLLIAFQSIAQTFPVQLTPQVTPPYPVYISEYANTNSLQDKVKLQVILNDLTVNVNQIRLKLYIQGEGIITQSTDFVVGAAPIFLEGGIPLQIGVNELAPYFEFQNLQGITPNTYGNALPEGIYQICFEVYDSMTNNVLSAKTCSTIVLFQNEPPLLNLPFNQSIIQEQNPLNIVFQWTPRHINVSNVQYEFSLVEIWDDYVAPQAAFLSTPPIFQTTVSETTLIYGPTFPQLITGRKYAWNVRAFALDGAEEIGVFTNQGHSEIFWFTYQIPCDTPLFPEVEDLSDNHVKLTWQGNSEHIDYTIKYREKNADSDWYQLTTPREYITITSLNLQTAYEYKIQGNCDYGSFGETIIYEFTTLSEEASAYIGCNIEPDPVDLSNQDILPELFVYDIIKAGDFPIVVTAIDQEMSPFSGSGFVVIPWLAFTRAKVEFNNIQVNTDMRLIAGEVKTTYDADWGSIQNLDGVVDDVFGDNGAITQYDASGLDINHVQVGENGSVVLVDENNVEHTIQVTLPVIITDTNGDQWLIDEDGNDTALGPQAEGGIPTSSNTTGIASNGSVNQISSPDVSVVFEKSGFYSTDIYPENVNNSSSLLNKYETIPTANGGIYKVLYKAISNIAQHDTDLLKATVTFSNGKTKDDIIFKTTEGTAVANSWDGNTATLTLNKQFNFAKSEMLATVKPEDSTQNYTIAGKTNLWHVNQQFVNVTVVPLNGASFSDADKARINEIYNPAGVNFNITVDPKLAIDPAIWNLENTTQEILDIGDSNLLSNYTVEERAIYNYYKTQRGVQEQMYYVFLATDITTSKLATNGFMPLKGQYGFVFKQNNQAEVTAHELGHGVFGLQHYEESGTEDFLMYNTYPSGTEFTHMDWQTMHASGLQFYMFQGDEDGASTTLNGIPDRFKNTINNTFTFMTIDGSYITLPSNVRRLSFVNSLDNLEVFSKFPTGALLGFELNNIKYIAQIETPTPFSDSILLDEFTFNYLGFIDQATGDDFPIEDDNKAYFGKVITLTLTEFSKRLGTIEINDLLWDNPVSVNILSNYSRFSKFYTSFPSDHIDISYSEESVFSQTFQLNEQKIANVLGENLNWGSNYLMASKFATLNSAYPLMFKVAFARLFRTLDADGASYLLKNKTNSQLITKYVEIINYIKSLNDDCAAFLGNLTDESSTDQLQLCITGLSDNEIKELSISNKLKAISLLINNWTVTEEQENQLIRLIEFTEQPDVDDLLFGLNSVSTVEGADYNLLRRLVYKTDNDHTYFHEDNFKKLINVLAELTVKKSLNFREELENLLADELIERNIKFYHKSFWDTAMADYIVAWNFLNGEDIFVYNTIVKWKTDSQTNADITVYTDRYAGSDILDTTDPIVLTPYSPIYFTNKSGLSMLSDFNNDLPVLSPAILALYASEVGYTQVIVDGIQATVDAASLASGFGALIKGPSIARKTFIIADMIGSGVSITTGVVGYTNLSTEGKAFVDALNVLTLTVAITDGLNTTSLKNIFGKVKTLDTALPDKSDVDDFLNTLIAAEGKLNGVDPNKIKESKVWLIHLEAELALNNINDLENKIVKAKRILSTGRRSILIGKLDNFTSLKTWVGELDDVADVALISKLNDFVDNSNSVLGKLNTYLRDAPLHISIDEVIKFKQALKQTRGIESFKLIDESIGVTGNISKFAYDSNTINKVSEISESSSNFRQAFGGNWEDELTQILKGNSNAKCLTCGNINTTNTMLKRLPSMDEMLENLEYVSQFHNKDGIESVFTAIKGKPLDIANSYAVNNRDGINHMIRYMKNNQDEFTNLTRFEFKYSDEFNNRADVLVGDIKYEFKSWTFGTSHWTSFFNPTGDLNVQLKRYIENTTELENLKYIFNGNKVNSSQIKTAFKSMMYDNATQNLTERGTEVFYTIWDNTSLRNDLFDLSETAGKVPIQQFKDIVSDPSNRFYKFIKVE